MLYVYNIYYCTCNTIYFYHFPLNLGIWSRNNWWPDGLVHFFFSFLKRTLALSACSFLKIYSLYIGTVKKYIRWFPLLSLHIVLNNLIYMIHFHLWLFSITIQLSYSHTYILLGMQVPYKYNAECSDDCFSSGYGQCDP